jgi:iron complex transport system permease protein
MQKQDEDALPRKEDPEVTRYRMVSLHHRRQLIGMLCLLLALIVLSLLSGRYPTAGISNPLSISQDRLLGTIILNVRLPRVILAIFGGAVLAGAGFVFQMLFANPLVEPGFLGVSQGAAFGAAGAIILFGYSATMVQISASFFGLLGLIASYVLAKRFRFGGWILRLVLSGIAVGALFSSGLSILKLFADPTTNLQDITFWMMGGLWNSSWSTVVSVLPTMMVALCILAASRWRINLLSLDDRTAHSIGLSPAKERSILLLVATIGTTAIISTAGLVGWVGLIIPHISRRVFGSDARFALPGSLVLGALFLLTCDTLGRTLLSGEIPLGILTSIIGSAVFIGLLLRKQTEIKL